MSEELKACPFCGIKPELASLVTPVRYFYLCPNCGVGNELQGFDRDEARRFWNTRPIEDELRAEIDRLQAELKVTQERCDRYEENMARHGLVPVAGAPESEV